MIPEAPATPETPAPEPTVEAPDAKPEPKPRLLSHGERMLPVKLTDEEKIEKGARLAEIQSEQKKVEEALDTAKRSAKSRLESLSLEAEEIGATLRRGTEERLVPYEEREEGSEAVLWRLDTGEEWTRRKLAPEERQGTLPLAPPAPPKPEPTPEALRVLVVSALHALGASSVIRVAEELVHAGVAVAPSRVAEVLEALAREGLAEHDRHTNRWRLTMAGQAAAAEIAAKVEAKEAFAEAPAPAAKTLSRTAAEGEEGSNEADRRKVLDAFRGGKELTRKELVAATGLSSEVVGDCLSDLVGLTAQVTKVGKGPGTRYARVLDVAAEPAPPTPKPTAPPASPPSLADPFALAGPRA